MLIIRSRRRCRSALRRIVSRSCAWSVEEQLLDTQVILFCKNLGSQPVIPDRHCRTKPVGQRYRPLGLAIWPTRLPCRKRPCSRLLDSQRMRLSLPDVTTVHDLPTTLSRQLALCISRSGRRWATPGLTLWPERVRSSALRAWDHHGRLTPPRPSPIDHLGRGCVKVRTSAM